ncbi:MAG: T9SS type A sorting domain-containing protein [Bacteroidia bacterium]|nr:T9SS type A sorting domain-containing protein [Bacteroidia bacterium]
MVKSGFSLCFFMAIYLVAGMAQSDCVAGRYTTEMFSSVSTTTVQYGKNIGINTSDSLNLMMDIYQPDGDSAEKRPVFIWAHGGSFISGNRSDMAVLCEQYAKMGYVTATIDYHLWPIFGGIPDSSDVVDVVIKSIGDMKGAIRYFKADQEGSNLYKIDSTRIIIGGISAGAIIAMHAGHLDTTDIIPQFIQDAIDNNGGLEGEANFLANSSNVLAVYNMSGALFKSEIIDHEDPSFISYHGTSDDVVPFRTGTAINIITLDGSGVCHEQADLINVTNRLDSVNGGGHTDIYDPNGSFSSNLESFIENANIFIGNQVCPGLISAATTFVPNELVSIFPNPAEDEIMVQLPSTEKKIYVRMFDALGRLINTREYYRADQFRISRPLNGYGIYFLEISTPSSRLAPVVKKVIFK